MRLKINRRAPSCSLKGVIIFICSCRAWVCLLQYDYCTYNDVKFQANIQFKHFLVVFFFLSVKCRSIKLFTFPSVFFSASFHILLKDNINALHFKHEKWQSRRVHGGVRRKGILTVRHCNIHLHFSGNFFFFFFPHLSTFIFSRQRH